MVYAEVAKTTFEPEIVSIAQQTESMGKTNQ